ncbi:bacterial trigger factor [Thalictrum thalictroides]|uniref:peptidylprolyl isomerase n=1 Tax=Thalictrum thalictroides TaxID=46969 RepID=A0A7J6VV62_THATH|nr:bacterial trigger factor [Thalictrum thalictroides]
MVSSCLSVGMVGLSPPCLTCSSSSFSKIITLNSNCVTFRTTTSEKTSTGIRVHQTNQHLSNGLSFGHGRGSRWLSQPSYAVNPELDTSVPEMVDIRPTLRKAKVVIESREGDTIQVRVDLTGKDTQKVFDDVLSNLARAAPAVPGFRRQKGGKTSNVPKEFLVRAIGEARVIKFVIQEIVSSTMTEYVEEASLKVKKEFKTIQAPEELESLFEPGNPFWFNATLDIDSSETETAAPSSSEV